MQTTLAGHSGAVLYRACGRGETRWVRRGERFVRDRHNFVPQGVIGIAANFRDSLGQRRIIFQNLAPGFLQAATIQTEGFWRIARFCRSNQRNTPDEVCRKTSRNLPQFRHATDFHPFDNKDISFVIKVGTVRRDELAGNEMVAGERPQILVAGAFAKVRDELVIFIEQRDA